MTAYEEEVYKNFGRSIFVKEALKENYGASLDDLYETIRKFEFEHTSYELFNGSILLMYPKISEQVSKKYRICDFSGAEIRPGSNYIRYSALLIDIYSHKRYVINPNINVECGYEYYLPRSIPDLDELALNISLGEYKDGVYYDILKKKYDGIPLQRIRKK